MHDVNLEILHYVVRERKNLQGPQILGIESALAAVAPKNISLENLVTIFSKNISLENFDPIFSKKYLPRKFVCN